MESVQVQSPCKGVRQEWSSEQRRGADRVVVEVSIGMHGVLSRWEEGAVLFLVWVDSET
jgi:hypothetical protein